MNKQEAIERIASNALNIGDNDLVVGLNVAKHIVNQIDELQKVVVPKFVAEWIEEAKAGGYTLYTAFDLVDGNDRTFNWLFDGHESNQDTFARAWLDGYEVEKEQLYTVEIADAILTKITRGRNVQYKMLPSKDVSDVFDKGIYATRLTETEIKQKDERLWQWAKPVEEN